jgi:orotidine-5'-phosphate decarboxylase
VEARSKAVFSNIVLALDINPEAEKDPLAKSLAIVKETATHLCGLKINRQLVLPLGLFGGVDRIVKAGKDLGLPVIMDCKINDVGHTNLSISGNYFKAGFDAVIASPFIGWKDGLEPVFKLAKQQGRGVILLVYMSHGGAEEGYGQKIWRESYLGGTYQYEVFAEKAVKWGADGAVVGATFPEKIERIRSILGDSVPIYSPGIGAQGGDVERAMVAGSKYLIVGRSIFGSENPGESAKVIKETANRFKNSYTNRTSQINKE